MIRTASIGKATLYLGDCRDVMPTLSNIDAVITDPPYGIGLKGKMCTSTGRRVSQRVRSETYLSYEDTQENFAYTVIPALIMALDKAPCGLVFMAGANLHYLPKWNALGGIYLPAGTGSGSWGFESFLHCALYGKDPYLSSGQGRRPNGKYGLWGNDANEVDHPCAKPCDAMLWAVIPQDN